MGTSYVGSFVSRLCHVQPSTDLSSCLINYGLLDCLSVVYPRFGQLAPGAGPEVLLPGGTAFVAEFRQTHYIFLHCRRYTFICIRTRQY